MTSQQIINGLSVDLEDWHSLVLRRLAGIESPPSKRMIRGTTELLRMLDRFGTKATFFVLGNVAEAFPDLVRDVAERGHEIGTHGHTHLRLHDIGPERFREELRASTAAIEHACGQKPRGHRAPEFSITKRSLWAFEILADEHFAYDSSVFPILHPRYGILSAPLDPYVVETRGRRVVELPLTILKVFGQRVPAAGGGYFRLLPFSAIALAIRQANRRGSPAVIYVHPYEFDPLRLGLDHPLPGVRARAFITGQNLFRNRSYLQLEKLLSAFPFAPLGSIINT